MSTTPEESLAAGWQLQSESTAKAKGPPKTIAVDDGDRKTCGPWTYTTRDGKGSRIVHALGYELPRLEAWPKNDPECANRWVGHVEAKPWAKEFPEIHVRSLVKLLEVLGLRKPVQGNKRAT